MINHIAKPLCWPDFVLYSVQTHTHTHVSDVNWTGMIECVETTLVNVYFVHTLNSLNTEKKARDRERESKREKCRVAAAVQSAVG